jgi:ABC-type multidrug transport system ATPase subunit
MPAPSSTPTDALRAEGAARTLAGVRALGGVSFSVAPGTLVGLVGANGSGKSTLLGALAGILAVDAGRVRVLGMDPVRDAPRLRARIGHAEQHPALDPELTGAETLRLFHALRGLSAAGREERIASAISTHGLDDVAGRRVSGWSGGERQRLHLALATLHAPEVLLLDEPTAALDPEGRRRLWGRLSEHRAAGGTALVATHDLAEVASHCDRVLLLHGGEVMADEAPASLVAAHGRARATITLPRDRSDDVRDLADGLRATPGEPEVEIDGGTITLWRRGSVAGPDPALALLDERGIEAVRYERTEADLASACRRLTGASVGAGRGRTAGRGRRR